MALPGDGIALRLDDPGDDSILYDAGDDRAAFTALMTPGGAGIAARAGRRPGAFTLSVGGSPEAVTVPAHSGIVTDPDGGAYIYAVPNAVTKSLATRPSSGTSRKDLVVAHIYDADVHAETSLRELDVEVVAGTAAAAPVAPTQPSGTLLLGTLTVPATGAVSVNNAGPRTVAVGGILPVANQAERDALAAYDGLVVYREDRDALETHRAGAWDDGTQKTYTPTLTNITKGNGTVTGRWQQVGKMVDCEITLTVGSTTSASGALMFSLPVPARDGAIAKGSAISQQSPFLAGVAYLQDTATVQVQGTTSPGVWNASQLPPAGKQVLISFRYEAA